MALSTGSQNEAVGDPASFKQVLWILAHGLGMGPRTVRLLSFILNQNFSFSAKSAPRAQSLHCYCGFQKLSTLILYFKRKEFPCVRTICFRKTRNETGNYRSSATCKQPIQHPWATVNNHSGERKMTSIHTFIHPKIKDPIQNRMPTGLSREKWCGFHICTSSSPLERVASSSAN